MRKIAIGVGIALIVLATGWTIFTAAHTKQPEIQKPLNTPKANQRQNSPSQAQAVGRYQVYTASARQDTGYHTSIVFFYAPWCPECRAFKKAIQASSIPVSTQILEADYDNSTDLKKQFSVTLQSTFVRVNTAGELQKKWVGYGKEKSLATVLENLK